MRRKIAVSEGRLALEQYLKGDRQQLVVAVRFLLEELATQFPGSAVEVRVPPYGAIQCVFGPIHSRGTPANVVELDPEAWVELAIGTRSFDSLVSEGKISASGSRSNLSGLFPIFVP